MPDETLSGASRDPIALLEQLIGHVAGLRRDVADLREEIQSVRSEFKEEIGSVRSEFKEEIGSVRSELKEEIQSVRSELKQEIQGARQDVNARLDGIRHDVRQFLQGTDRREEAQRTWLEESFNRRSYLYAERLREEWEPRLIEVERRLSILEESEYQRKQKEKT